MSKAVKTVVSVVAAIAIPFAAPAIASSIGLSAAIGTAVGSATAGSVIGGAITGAALGAAKSAVLGEDVGRGAIMGGIGGGVGGYNYTPTTTSPYSLTGGTTAPSVTDTVSYTVPSGPVDYTLAADSLNLGGGTGLTLPGATTPSADLGLSGSFGGTGTGLTLPSTTAPTTGLNLSSAMAPVDYSLTAGAQFPTFGLNPATAGVGFRAPDPGFFNAAVSQSLASGTPVDYSLAAGAPPSQGLQVVTANPLTGGTQTITPTGTFQSTTPISQYSGGSYVGPTGAATAPISQGGTGAQTPQLPTQPKTFADALSQVPGKIADKFTDPNALADLTLRAAGLLAGSAIAGDGLSNEERKLLDAQAEELRTLQQTNASLFAQRLEQAQNLIGESKYFDPEYFGLQRARRAQLAGAKAKRAGLRGLTGAAREAESRRFDLATGRDVGTAFDQGYLTGVGGRLQTMQAGLSAMPYGYPAGALGGYSDLRRAYDAAAGRTRQTQSDIGSLFGSLTGGSRSQYRG